MNKYVKYRKERERLNAQLPQVIENDLAQQDQVLLQNQPPIESLREPEPSFQEPEALRKPQIFNPTLYPEIRKSGQAGPYTDEGGVELPFEEQREPSKAKKLLHGLLDIGTLGLSKLSRTAMRERRLKDAFDRYNDVTKNDISRDFAPYSRNSLKLNQIVAEEEESLDKSKTLLDNIREMESTLNEAIPEGKIKGFLNSLNKQYLTESVPYARYKQLKALTLSNMVRDYGGEKGVLTDQDLNRARELTLLETDTQAERRIKVNGWEDLINDLEQRKLKKLKTISGSQNVSSTRSKQPYDKDQAYQWAIQNKNDPRAQKILEILGR